MKNISQKVKYSFVKKIFIKLCRLLGFEIIDQSNFYLPTDKKFINDNLSIPGKKSIVIPLGKVEISRKIKDLTIIFRCSTGVNMLSQNKSRLFEKEKFEYTLRSLNSIIISVNDAIKNFNGIKIKLFVIDHESKKEILNKINSLLANSKLESKLLKLDVNEFENKIKKINAENKQVTKNQISNMSNIYKSLEIAKNECDDIIYFVEDDYIHQKNSIGEMLYTYERLASMIKKELVLCPVDYPFLYNKIEPTNVFLGASRHWRTIDETLVTFLTSKDIVEKYWDLLKSMCEYEHYPFESPLHEIYKKEMCISPIPSLAMHCTNINSAYGIPPNFDWKKNWDESAY